MPNSNEVPQTGTTGHTLDQRGVNHPAHYNLHPSKVEAIEAIRCMSFNVGSSWKYMMRLGEKAEPGLTIEETIQKDLDKICWYLRDEIANCVPGYRPKPTIHALNAMAKITNAEPVLLKQQFYSVVWQFCEQGALEMLEYALTYTLALKKYPQ